MISASCAFYCVEHWNTKMLTVHSICVERQRTRMLATVFRLCSKWSEQTNMPPPSPPGSVLVLLLEPWLSGGLPLRLLQTNKDSTLTMTKSVRNFQIFGTFFYSKNQGMLIHKALSISDPSSNVNRTKKFLQNDFETFQCFRAFLLCPSLRVGCVKHPIRDWDWFDQRLVGVDVVVFSIVDVK